MSQPTFPTISPEITRDKALNMILASIASEELGLSHIINAEGEKIQYVLGTLPGSPGTGATVEQVIDVNRSVKCLLDSVMQNQLFLKNKMEKVLDSIHEPNPGPTGPAGATGPAGPSGNSCISAFTASPGYCWKAGDSLPWTVPRCTPCRSACLEPDHTRIALACGKCFLISFSINLCVPRREDQEISIGLQTLSSGKRADEFVYRMPSSSGNARLTASAAGIMVSTRGALSPVQMMLTLLSPCPIQAEQASIAVMEMQPDSPGCFF